MGTHRNASVKVDDEEEVLQKAEQQWLGILFNLKQSYLGAWKKSGEAAMGVSF